jgi:Protein of unknown function (DUF2800)
MIGSDGAAHAFLAPSDAANWMLCPGKPAVSEHEPDRSSPAAEFGTLAHELAAQWLKTGCTPSRWDKGPEAEAPQLSSEELDLRDGVHRYVAAVMEAKANFERQGAKVTLRVEQSVPVGMITGERNADGSYATGTSDVVMLCDFGDRMHLDVWDLKFGTGVPVPVAGNAQLQLYALATYVREAVLHDIRTIDLVIHQPRLVADPARWTISSDDLLVFGKQVTEAAALSLSLRNSAEALTFLVPGTKQCRFCRFAARCPALARYVQTEVLSDFAGVKQPESVKAIIQGRTLSRPEAEVAKLLGAQLGKLSLVRCWADAVEAEAEYLALQKGVHIPGYKVVDGRAGNREYVDDEEVHAVLSACEVPEDLFLAPAKLKTPAQLEKVLKGPKFFAVFRQVFGDPNADPPDCGLITRSPPKPALVPDSDPRPARTDVAQASEFQVPR